jgi:Carboxypeptidase regulatory-like domain
MTFNVEGVAGAGANSMMKTIRMFLGSALLGLLASCGGGGGCGGDSFGSNNCPGPGTQTASDLTIVLDKQSVSNADGTGVTASVTAVDSNRNALSGIAVTVSVDNGATVNVSGSETNESGVVTGDVSIGSDRANRIVTVTASSGSLQVSASFSVVGATLSSTAVPSELGPGDEGIVQYRVLDSNQAPMQGVTIVVDAPGGVQTEGVTDSNGRFDFDYVAPTSIGPFTVSADAAGVQTSTSIVVRSGATVTPPAVGPIVSASVASVPSVVTVNTATSNNQTEVRALFIGEANAAIKNVRVRFDLAGDAFSIGGTLASGTQLVLSDDTGIARTSYRPGSRSSGANALTIRACWDLADFAVGTCPNAVTTTMVVVNEPLSITIGTDGFIVPDDANLLYYKRFVVQVVDSAGQVKSGVTVTGELEPLQYLKGSYSIPDGVDQWVSTTRAVCDNEDLNRNGINEVFSSGIEDANATGVLDPSAADVGLTYESGKTTNSSGIVILRMQYPQNVASWLIVKLKVTAGVLGTEGRKEYVLRLPVPASVVTTTDATPAFVVSPYGVEPSPLIQVTTPEGQSGFLCTNPT